MANFDTKLETITGVSTILAANVAAHLTVLSAFFTKRNVRKVKII